MIYGNLQKFPELGGAISGKLKEALDYLKGSDIAVMKEGRNEVMGDDMYTMLINGMTKPALELKAEAHLAYTDIHYAVSGSERIGFALDASGLKVVKDLREQDALLYDHVPGETFLHLKEGEFLVLFPGEVHRTGVCAEESAPFSKLVVKIRL